MISQAVKLVIIEWKMDQCYWNASSFKKNNGENMSLLFNCVRSAMYVGVVATNILAEWLVGTEIRLVNLLIDFNAVAVIVVVSPC